MANVQFRDATAADLPAIVAMLADDRLGAGREDASLPLDPRYLDAFAAIGSNPGQRLIVACDNGRAIGTLQLTFLPGLSKKGAWRGQIEGVRIASHRRGAGLGEQLMRWAIEECRLKGCVAVQLTTDASRAEAQRFYERLGFTASHVGYQMVLPT
jgi:ribosomal protein S18 acetylase RimI-like enzyme